MIKTIKKVLGANVLVQLMGMAIYPVLMTFYKIEEMSIYGLLYGGMTISSIIFSFRVENLFFNLKLRDAFNLYSYYVKFIFIPVLIVFCFLFYVFRGNLNEWAGKAILIGLSGCFFAGFNVVYNILVRLGNENYNKLKVLRAFLELIVVGISVFLYFDIERLFFLVSLTYFLVMVVPILYIDWSNKLKNISLSSNYKFLALDIISSLANTVYLYAPNYFLYFGGNVKISGYYFLITRLFGIPSLMVAQSLSTTLKQYLSGKSKITYKRTLFEFSEQIFNKIYIFYILFCFLAVFAFLVLDRYLYKDIIYVFFIMLPLLIFRFKFLVYSGLFYVLKAYRENFNLQLFLLVGSALAILLGWLSSSSWLSLFLYVFFTILIYKYFLKLILSKAP